MSYKGKIKRFNLYQVSGDRDDNTRELMGVGLPFSGHAKGLTLLFDNGLKLIMYPHEKHNRKFQKFVVCSVDKQGDTQHRVKVGEGWRFKSGKGYRLTVSYEGIEMSLILLPK
ncbi:MAG: hypothetical protein AAFR77_05150 [Cyanobacteria bacterium J06631_2]